MSVNEPAAVPPRLTRSYQLDVGAVAVEVVSQDPALTFAVPGQVAPFVTTTVRPPDVRLRARWGDPAAAAFGPVAFDSGSLWRLYGAPGAELRFVFSSPATGGRPYKSACLAPDFASGDIVLDRSVHPETPNPLEYPIDELLVMHHLCAAKGRGVELHASGLIDDGGGYLFVGQSGAGKTTAARLWSAHRRATILSDDRVVVRPDGDGFVMWGTPWHGEGRYAAPGPARLRGVFLLEQAAEVNVRALSPALAVGRLLSAAFFPFYDRNAAGVAMHAIETLVARVPCRALSFRKDTAFVDEVRAFRG